MDETHEYLKTLGAFRQSAEQFTAAAHALAEASAGQEEHPLAVQVVADVTAELRAVATSSRGFRQLLSASIGGL